MAIILLNKLTSGKTLRTLPCEGSRFFYCTRPDRVRSPLFVSQLIPQPRSNCLLAFPSLHLA